MAEPYSSCSPAGAFRFELHCSSEKVVRNADRAAIEEAFYRVFRGELEYVVLVKQPDEGTFFQSDGTSTEYRHDGRQYRLITPELEGSAPALERFVARVQETSRELDRFLTSGRVEVDQGWRDVTDELQDDSGGYFPAVMAWLIIIVCLACVVYAIVRVAPWIFG
jgi:hypothetical protein